MTIPYTPLTPEPKPVWRQALSSIGNFIVNTLPWVLVVWGTITMGLATPDDGFDISTAWDGGTMFLIGALLVVSNLLWDIKDKL